MKLVTRPYTSERLFGGAPFLQRSGDRASGAGLIILFWAASCFWILSWFGVAVAGCFGHTMPKLFCQHASVLAILVIDSVCRTGERRQACNPSNLTADGSSDVRDE